MSSIVLLPFLDTCLVFARVIYSLGEVLDITLPLLGEALLLSCLGNSIYVPWQEDRLERRYKVDIGPEGMLTEEIGSLRMVCLGWLASAGFGWPTTIYLA
jgi:hypothetical protein